MASVGQPIRKMGGLDKIESRDNLFLVMKHEQVIRDFLKTKLGTDKAWACRAVVKLYERQTMAEQAAGLTKEHNTIGFNGTDAEFLSSIAEKLNKGWNLNENQMVWVFKKVPKYWRQVWSLIPQPKQSKITAELTGECPDCGRGIVKTPEGTFCTGKCGWNP